MTCVESIQKSIEYIESNLKDKISVSQLARVAGYSPFHYSRVFHILTGMSIMDYVRKRRLTNATIEIHNTGKSIKEIAFDWGFNSHENFVRAFRSCFAISPTTYRKSKYGLNLFYKINLTDSAIEDIDDCSEPEFIYREGLKIAGLGVNTTWQNNRHFKELPALINKYYSDRIWETIPDRVDTVNRIDFGCTYNFSNNGDDTLSFDWITGVEVQSLEMLPQNIIGKEIPQANYAVFTTPGGDSFNLVKNISRTWRYIYVYWLQNSGYKHAGTHELETYCPDINASSKQIWIPIVKKD